MIARESGQKFADLVYDFLLMLYPPAFRLRFGPDMVQVFRDTYPGEAQEESVGRRLAFWLWTLGDVVRSVPGEWAQALLEAEGIDALIGTLADSLAVPAWIITTLVAQGYTCAILTQCLQNLMLPGHPHALSKTGLFVVAAVATCGLGMISALAAWAIGRGNRLQNPLLKL